MSARPHTGMSHTLTHTDAAADAAQNVAGESSPGAATLPHLHAAWQRVWASSDGTPPSAEDESRRAAALVSFLSAHTQPTRAYHAAAHIEDCLGQLERYAPSHLRGRRDLMLALLYHDVVYNPRATGGVNEDESAEVARRDIQQLLREPDRVVKACQDRVTTLIEYTKHGVTPPDEDDEACTLVDIDLSILGRDAEAFRTYDQAIRKEYAHVPEDAYIKGRAAVLQTFLRRERIFLTPTFRDLYEAPARENLRRTIAALEARAAEWPL